MPTYIRLINLTDQAVQNVKQMPGRLDEAKARVKAMGGELKAFYLTMGRYDAVAIVEAPDDETSAAMALAAAAQANTRTETLRAFDEDEFRRIVGRLP